MQPLVPATRYGASKLKMGPQPAGPAVQER